MSIACDLAATSRDRCGRSGATPASALARFISLSISESTVSINPSGGGIDVSVRDHT
jgi:hypothetical protein